MQNKLYRYDHYDGTARGEGIKDGAESTMFELMEAMQALAGMQAIMQDRDDVGELRAAEVASMLRLIRLRLNIVHDDLERYLQHRRNELAAELIAETENSSWHMVGSSSILNELKLATAEAKRAFADDTKATSQLAKAVLNAINQNARRAAEKYAIEIPIPITEEKRIGRKDVLKCALRMEKYNVIRALANAA